MGTPRIALVSTSDPTDPDVNSGVPAGLLAALNEICDTVPVHGRLGAAERRMLRLAAAASLRVSEMDVPTDAARSAMTRAEMGRAGVWLRSRRIAAKLATEQPIDACIQLGSEFSLPTDSVSVTLDDATVVQARSRYPWPQLDGKTNARRWRRRQLNAYRRARACCAASHWTARSIVEDYGISDARVHVVGLGRNHVVSPPPDRDWSVPSYLFIGLDWERKNGAAVVGAFKEVRAKLPSARLAVVGLHPRLDSDGIEGFGRLALSNGADRRRIADLLRSSTCLVMPSWHEPVGIVHAEAAGAGLPSIGSSAGGSATVIGGGGLIVAPDSPVEITRAMLELANPVRARELGAIAHTRAGLFTWRKVAERVLRAIAPPQIDSSGLADFL